MSVIEWMKSKAAVETLSDGTIIYRFQGNLPGKMTQEVKKSAQNWRDCGTSFAYSTSGKSWGWGAVFGASKSTANAVQFTFNDYTAPMHNDVSPIVQFLRSMNWTR